MEALKKIGEIKIETEEFLQRLEGICDHLKGYETMSDLSSLKKLIEDAYKREENLFSEDRKLQVAVMGEVKAGKSTFLNTLLFEGKSVLPKAVTPQTAVLTKIEYGTYNALELTYYSTEEWEALKERAALNEESTECRIAKEITDLAEHRGLNVEEYTSKQVETIHFESVEALIGQLENYVGEDGYYTPITKCVTLKLHEMALENVSIVDTPGLSDPVVSRTAMTKAFLEKCDIVFFLSKASNFLSQSDMDLLTHQLPQKGVREMVLVASRYDDGLIDASYDEESLEKADETVRTRLTRHAGKTLSAFIENEGENYPESWMKLFENLKKPYFVSSVAYAMSQKAVEEYDVLEKHVYESLCSQQEKLPEGFLESISGIDKIKPLFNKLIDEKEKVLRERAAGFITDFVATFKKELVTLQDMMERHIYFLKHQDESSIQRERQYITRQLHSMAASIEEIFGELSMLLEESKMERIRELREGSKAYIVLQEQVGTETGQGVHTKSNSKWYRPASWGTSREESYNYEKNYYYIGPANALENIRNFVVDATNALEDTFYQSVQLPSLKNKLLTVIVENFDTAEENYDPMYFKLLAERALSKIELPIIRIDISDVLEELGNAFTGEIRGAAEKADLRQAMVSSISKLFDELTSQFVEDLKVFKEKLSSTKTTFLHDLEESLTSDLKQMLEQMQHKEEEIKKSEAFIKDAQYLTSQIESWEL